MTINSRIRLILLSIILFTLLSCNESENKKDATSSINIDSLEMLLSDEISIDEYDIKKENYNIKTLNWKGGPTPTSPEIINDFYNQIFPFSSDFIFDQNSKNKISVCGSEFGEMIQGIYGISHYSGLGDKIDEFSYNLNLINSLKERDFGDLTYIEDLIGISIYNKRKEKKKN